MIEEQTVAAAKPSELSAFLGALKPECFEEIARFLEKHYPRKFYPLWYEALEQAAALSAGLAESVKLQSHYAELLNMHDGGQRMTFADVDSWLERLRSLPPNASLSRAHAATEPNRADDSRRRERRP